MTSSSAPSLLSPETLGNPWPVYRELQRNAPVYWAEPLQAWLVTRRDDVQACFRDPRLSANRTQLFAEHQLGGLGQDMVREYLRVTGQMMLMRDGAEHARPRRLANTGFTPPALDNVRAVCHSLRGPREFPALGQPRGHLLRRRGGRCEDRRAAGQRGRRPALGLPHGGPGGAPQVPREDFELRGQPIRKGQLVFLGIAAANRDPAVFAEPDAFDITRQPNRHVAFAFGPHMCLGAGLARRELEMALEALLRRMPELRLDAQRPARLKCNSLVLRGFDSLPVRW